MGEQIDKELRAIIERIEAHEGSYRKISERLGVSADVFSRVMNKGTGLASSTVRLLAAEYGDAFGFTEEDALYWAHHMSEPTMGAAHRSGISISPHDHRAIMREVDETYRRVERLRQLLIETWHIGPNGEPQQ